MTDVFFYHLLDRSLEQALPSLLEKSLQRGWRAVVQCASAARLKLLDDALWSYSAESFLPHSVVGDGDAAAAPILLTTGDDNPNGAAVRVFVERCAVLPALERSGDVPYTRALLIFDGRDLDDVQYARDQWRAVKGRGYPVTYWQQDDAGRWNKKQ